VHCFLNAGNDFVLGKQFSLCRCWCCMLYIDMLMRLKQHRQRYVNCVHQFVLSMGNLWLSALNTNFFSRVVDSCWFISIMLLYVLIHIPSILFKIHSFVYIQLVNNPIKSIFIQSEWLCAPCWAASCQVAKLPRHFYFPFFYVPEEFTISYLHFVFPGF